MTTTAFGLRHAIPSIPTPVDLSAISYDTEQQVSVIQHEGVTLPVLKHSTGQTATNTAKQDNAGGADSDTDQTED